MMMDMGARGAEQRNHPRGLAAHHARLLTNEPRSLIRDEREREGGR